MTLLLAPMEGLLDFVLRDVLTRVGGVDRCVSEFIRITGTLTGVNEDGPNRQVLNGTLYFDLDSNHISYLSIRGEHHLLDKDGKTAGKVEGLFVMTRSLNPRSRDLTDDAVRRLSVEPNAENTTLLYDNREIGIRFLYPRRWHVTKVSGPQITLDEVKGSGLLLTVEPAAKIPTGKQYLAEALAYIQQQKGRVLSQGQPAPAPGVGQGVEHFALEVEMGGQKALLDYYVGFNRWKSAAIVHGVYARYLEGKKSTAGVDLQSLKASILRSLEQSEEAVQRLERG